MAPKSPYWTDPFPTDATCSGGLRPVGKHDKAGQQLKIGQGTCVQP